MVDIFNDTFIHPCRLLCSVCLKCSPPVLKTSPPILQLKPQSTPTKRDPPNASTTTPTGIRGTHTKPLTTAQKSHRSSLPPHLILQTRQAQHMLHPRHTPLLLHTTTGLERVRIAPTRASPKPFHPLLLLIAVSRAPLTPSVLGVLPFPLRSLAGSKSASSTTSKSTPKTIVITTAKSSSSSGSVKGDGPPKTKPGITGQKTSWKASKMTVKRSSRRNIALKTVARSGMSHSSARCVPLTTPPHTHTARTTTAATRHRPRSQMISGSTRSSNSSMSACDLCRRRQKRGCWPMLWREACSRRQPLCLSPPWAVTVLHSTHKRGNRGPAPWRARDQPLAMMKAGGT